MANLTPLSPHRAAPLGSEVGRLGGLFSREVRGIGSTEAGLGALWFWAEGSSVFLPWLLRGCMKYEANRLVLWSWVPVGEAVTSVVLTQRCHARLFFGAATSSTQKMG